MKKEKEDYEYLGPFTNGYRRVKKDGKWNLIDNKGNTISKEWFKSVSSMSNEGFALVLTDEGYNYINVSGRKVMDKPFKNAGTFENGFAPVMNDDYKWNYINNSLRFLCKKWYPLVKMTWDKDTDTGMVYDGKGNEARINRIGMLVGDWKKSEE